MEGSAVVPRLPRLQTLIGLWLPVLAWAGLIFYLSSLPNLRITLAWYDIVLRKFAHVFFFGALALLVHRALAGSTRWPTSKIIISAWTFAFLYALTDEFHQSFVEGRRGSLADVAIDAVGAWLALRIKA